MGRIPLFVDTDCPLPFSGQLTWDELMCRVTPEEIPRIDLAVTRHAARFPDLPSRALRLTRLRKVWQDWLTWRFS